MSRSITRSSESLVFNFRISVIAGPIWLASANCSPALNVARRLIDGLVKGSERCNSRTKFKLRANDQQP